VSARTGPYRTARTPYVREPLEALVDPHVESVALMWASQVGKTELLNIAVGYYSHWEPSLILVSQPTVEAAEIWSKERWAPAVRNCAALRAIYPEPKSRSAGNTLLAKQFAGGHLAITGANAATGLSMRPRRCFFADEVDRYPPSAGTEGDALALGRQRTRTFWNRVLLYVSSPGVEGASQIAPRYEVGTQERWHVPCPHCGQHQVLTWDRVIWTGGDPDTALYHCVACDVAWSEPERIQAIERGQWVAQAQGARSRSFHLPALASAFVSLPQLAHEWLEAQSDPEALQAFINLILAELWEGAGETLDPEQIADRAHPIGPLAPGVIVVLGADVQADRIEAEIVAFDPETRESWSIGYHVLHGDPRLRWDREGSPWLELEELLGREYPLEGGGVVRLRSGMVDAGYLFDEVCSWCKRHARRGIYPCRGEAGAGKGWIHGASRKNRTHAKLFRLGVDAIKAALYRLLALTEGPGTVHTPPEYPLDWYAQLTAERVRTRHRGGRPELVWELPMGRRNEALDCRVYAMAALERVRPRRSAILRMPVDKSVDNSAAEPARTFAGEARAWDREGRRGRGST
jgi:phage terminase large subunit GpA-like protein